MKLIYTLTSTVVLGLSSFASAQATCEAGTCSKGKCEAGSCAAGTCKDGCACDSKTAASSAHFSVSGMTCNGCSGKVTKALEATEGVTVKKVCHKSGCAVVEFDSAKTDKTKIQAAINATGFKVAGEQISIPVTGMTCKGCSGKVTTALEALEGCSVGKVCHKSGHAQILVDTSKTSKAKVIEAINATGFKAVTEAPKAAPAKKEAVKAPAKKG